MNELALFAGGGGSVWASALLGHRVVCAIEIEAFQRSVLLARQRDGSFPVFPVWDDIRTFNGNPWRGAVDLVEGGFPCTDISLAGKGAGIDGEKSGLWREMARVIAEVQPRFVFVENVRALVSRGLDRVLGDLADLGFDAEWDCFRASDVGAPHKRERLFILAYRAGSRLSWREDAGAGCGNEGEGTWSKEPERGGGSVDDSDIMAYRQGDGRHQGRTQPSRQQGRPDASECGGSLADPSNGQLQEPGRRPEGRERARPAQPSQWNDAPQLVGAIAAVAHTQSLTERESADQTNAIPRSGAAWDEPGDECEHMAYANEQHGDAGGHGTSEIRGQWGQAGTIQGVVQDDSGRERCQEQRGPIAGEPELSGLECPGFPPPPNDSEGWVRYIAKGGPVPAVRRSASRISDELNGALAHRSKRLETLGNAWVPHCAAFAFRILLRRLGPFHD